MAKLAGLAVERLGDHGGEDRHREHPQDHEDAVRRVVGVEAVGVERVADPGPPDGDEQPGEDQEAAEARILGEPVGELRDRDDEDEVEEELEPGRVPLVLAVLLQRAKTRRVVPPGGGRHPLENALAAAEFRLALLREGRQALAGVLGREREVERLALVVEAGLEGRSRTRG